MRSLLRSPVLLSLLLSSLTLPLMAKELYEEKKVSHIEVIIESPSQDSVDPKPVLSKLKTKEGDLFSQGIFDADLKQLAEEYDKVEPSVDVKNGTLVITLRVTPKPYIHQILWEGNSHVSTSTLQKELGIEPYTRLDRQAFIKAFNKVKEYYFKKGYFEAQLSYTVEPIPGTNNVDVVIHIQEGRPGHIREVVLEGLTDDEKTAIREQIYLKKHNFFTSWLTGSGTYREELLEQDRMTILNYLHNEGYADAKVDVDLQEDPDSGKLLVYIRAEKGQIYHFGKVSFQGNTLFSTEEIEKKSLVQEGGVFSPEKVRETSQRIKDFYGQKGYIDTSVQFETLLQENDPIFNVDFTIEEGGQYKIGLIHIFGNSSTKNNVILRESLLVPGETFDSRKLKATQQRLEAIGYFKSVNVYAVRAEDDSKLGEQYRDVYIEVEETTTGNISLFMGFSSTDDVFGGIDLTERNFDIKGIGKALTGRISELRGGGEFFHVRGTVGKSQNNVLISWMDPYVNDSLWRLGVELSRTFSELQKGVDVVTYGGSVYTNYPLSSYWTAGMRQRVRHSKDDLNIHKDGSTPAIISHNDATAPIESLSVDALKRQLDQKGLVSAFSGNVSYDSTDSAFKPHRGWRSYLEAEVAGVGGSYDFAKFSYINSLYFPVYSKGTFKLRADFKYILPFGKTSHFEVPYSERLFLGGEGTVRGYKPFLLGPTVNLPDGSGGFRSTHTPFGGLSSSMASLEYNQEIFRMLDIFAFCDVGSLEYNNFTISHIRPSVGAGLRIDIGNRTPIVVGYGFPLCKKDRHGEKWQKVFFSMGGQF